MGCKMNRTTDILQKEPGTLAGDDDVTKGLYRRTLTTYSRNAPRHSRARQPAPIWCNGYSGAPGVTAPGAPTAVWVVAAFRQAFSGEQYPGLRALAFPRDLTR